MVVGRQRRHEIRVAWAPSVVRRILRHRAVWLIVVLGTAVMGAASLSAQSAQAAAQRDGWGASRQVVVVADRVEVGESLRGRVELQELPRSLVPDSALAQVGDDSRAKVLLMPGEVVLSHRITQAGGSLLPSGTSALTLPVLARVPLVGEGDLVDVWMLDSANLSSNRVAEAVVVLALGDRDITVAVRDDDIAHATVASLRPVTITLVG